MKFNVEAKSLSAALSILKGAIATRSTMPVLACARIEATTGTLIVTGSDLTNECSVKIPAEVEAHGVTAIPASVLSSIAKSAKASTLTFDLGPDRLARIGCGRSRYTIATVDTRDFPVMDDQSGITATLPAADLLRILAATRHAHSSDPARYYLNGAYLHTQGKHLVAAATDGHRCVVAKMPLPPGLNAMPSIIVGSATIDLMRTILATRDSVTITVNERTVSFVCDDTVVIGRCIEGSFPDYARAIPAISTTILVRTEAERIVAGLDALSAIDDAGASFPIRIGPGTPETVAMMARRNTEGREARAEIEGEGSAAQSGVNARYLKDALGIWPEGAFVEVQQGHPGAPLRIVSDKAPDLVAVVMPMRAPDEASVKEAAE